ncbi:MAG: T9SS type A sorting domain-containing protein [bacterium]|nr:T9SS type A sorting domain-containing protein [bacterium]
MKKITVLLAGLLVGFFSFSQTTLFSDNFESGSGQWVLNSSGSGANNWVVNNAYLGFSGLIPDTPNQPGGITGSPQSFYMHITNTTVCGGLSVCNANYDAGATSDIYTRLATPIDASNATGITLSFWYLCQGLTGTAFGTLEYSIDGGTTWTPTGTVYQNTGAWTQESVTLPAWDNVAALSFRYRWQNTSSGSGTDPSFSIDDILIEGTTGGGGGSNTITTATDLSPNAWCQGQTTTIQVNFTSTGTFNAGNIYSAELSDASGSFAAPTVVGTLNSTANSGTITAVISGATPAGTGYRIRVVSDNPAVIGTDNTVDLAINALPNVTQAAFSDVCSTGGAVNLVGGSPSGGTYSGTGASGTQFDPSVSGLGSFPLTYTYTDANGCINSAVETITVIQGPTVTLSAFSDVCDTDPFFTLTGGNPSNGTYSGPGVTGGVFNPATAGVGTHTITYTFTDGNGCDGTANETITVNDCASLNENNLISFEILPNPTNGTFQIVSQSPIDHVSLMDMSGRVIKEFEAGSSYSIQELPSGMYMVRVQAEGLIKDQRLMKQ